MKRINKCILMTLIGSVMVFPLTAQSSDAEEKLVLPDVTTTVSGDSLIAGKDALPDYSVVLPELRSAKSLLPTLPGVEAYDDFDEPVADLSVSWNKSVFCQGLIGGGFPGYFTGEFSVYKETIDSPFSINFAHLSRHGYGNLPASDGYFDMLTSLGGIKEFTVRDFDFTIGAGYEAFSCGLQNLSNVFYDQTSQDVEVTLGGKWNLPKGFTFALNNTSGYYYRYGGIYKGADVEGVVEQSMKASAFSTAPELAFSWKNEFLRAAVKASYGFEKYIQGETEGESGKDVSNRGRFDLSFDWINNILNVGLGCGLVIGDSFGNENKLVVPFDVKLTGSWEVPYSSIPVTLYAAGGLTSERLLLSDLEREYGFSFAKQLSTECSDWYGKASLGIPLVKSAKLSVGVDFKKTAFDDLMTVCDYTAVDEKSGLYSFVLNDRTQLDVLASGEFFYKVFGFNVSVMSHFMYVPVKEDRIFVDGSCSYESSSGKWGTEVSVREAVGDNADLVPNVGASAFIKISDALRISLDMNDAIKLFSGTTRVYAHSNYKQSAGNVILLVKFFF